MADSSAIERGDAVRPNSHHPRRRGEIAPWRWARHRKACTLDRALEIGRERLPLGIAAFAEPARETVALRALALPASVMASTAAAPGTITTTWSGASGSSFRLG